MASSVPKASVDLDAAIREVTKGYDLSDALHSLLRQVIPRGDGRLESACRLSKEVHQILGTALEILKPAAAESAAETASEVVAAEPPPPPLPLAVAAAAAAATTTTTTTTTTTVNTAAATNNNGAATNNNNNSGSSRKAKFRTSSDPLALEISLPNCSETSTSCEEIKESESDQERDQKIITTSRKRSLDSDTIIVCDGGHECPHSKASGEKKIIKPKAPRGSHLNSWTTTTNTPFNDGHQWRKYGEKKIMNCKMTRCYYRCTHKDDQGCPATKQVQQKDNEDPPSFVVTYNRQHTCKKIIINTDDTNYINFSNSEQYVVDPILADPCKLAL